MPTGRITFPGGVSSPITHPPQLPGPRRGVRGRSISVGSSGIRTPITTPTVTFDYGAKRTAFYAGFVPEVYKANYLHPTNQGYKALQASNYSRMASPRNTPARSLYAEGYTDAIQLFAASNTWQIAGATSVGTRAKQPSTKFVSPFSNNPIPVSMPWDI